MSTTQTPAAPKTFFLTYLSDRVTTVRNEVFSISCYVKKDKEKGDYVYFIAIGYAKADGSGVDYYRIEDRRPERKRAIEAMRGHLWDHFNRVPALATLQIERGEKRAFPASSARPFAKVAQAAA